MCSIIGYYGSGKAAPIMVSGLKRMEYRGYDSVGIATKVENAVQIRKGVGRVDEVNRAENLDGLDGTVGIGHTRSGQFHGCNGKVTLQRTSSRKQYIHGCNSSQWNSPVYLIEPLRIFLRTFAGLKSNLYWWRLFCRFFFDLFEHFFHDSVGMRFGTSFMDFSSSTLTTYEGMSTFLIFSSTSFMGEFGTSFMDFSSSTLTTYEGMSTIRSPI